jgi:hypothetical protein
VFLRWSYGWQATPHTIKTMPFLFIGILLLGIGVFFLRRAIKQEDKEGVVGLTALIIAAVILILFYGLFYSITIP